MTKNKLNIALIGYGKMGKIIEKIAIERGHTISIAISSRNRDKFSEVELKKVDVAIEFSTPKAVIENLLFLAENKVPTVCGTTAWLDKYDDVSAAFQIKNTGFLYASNFSIGVNILFALNQQLAKLMNYQTNYQVSMTEAHHVTKKDAPSGTAVTLANQIITEIERKQAWSLEENKDKDIQIEVIREEDVKGMHEIKYNSEIDTISIKHEAHSRVGFALGAVMAAEFIYDKSGIHSMPDVLNLSPAV